MPSPSLSRHQLIGGILAGGLSRRMDGNDKAFADLNGKPMLHHAIERLKPQISDLLVNTNSNSEVYSKLDYPIIRDEVGGHAGPLAGIHAMLNFISKNHRNITHLVTIAVDTPLFPKDFVDVCIRACNRSKSVHDTIVLARSNGNRHPVFGLWPVKLLNSLDNFLRHEQSRKVMLFVEQRGLKYADFETCLVQDQIVDPFFNINSADELELANRIFEMQQSQQTNLEDKSEYHGQ